MHKRRSKLQISGPAWGAIAAIAAAVITATAAIVGPVVTERILRTPAPTIAPATEPAFKLLNLTSPVAPSAQAAVSIQTEPSASCMLSYTTPRGTASEAKGLGLTGADGNGVCSWTWTIGSETGPGLGRLTITAGGVTQNFEIIIK